MFQGRGYEDVNVHGDVVTNNSDEPLTTLCELDPDTNFNQDRHSCLVAMATFNASMSIVDTPEDAPLVTSINVDPHDLGYETT
jgi:hypothetical protein